MNRLVQYGATALIGVILVAAPLQMLIAAGLGANLFYLTAIISLLFIPAIAMLIWAAPPVTLNDDGLTITPLIGRDCFVRWEDIAAVKDYPLLPTQDQEVNRRLLVGRKKYRHAEGKMLVIPSLPLPYRATGLFAGEGGKPVIALTNRTHTDYDSLIRTVLKHMR